MAGTAGDSAPGMAGTSEGGGKESPGRRVGKLASSVLQRLGVAPPSRLFSRQMGNGAEATRPTAADLAAVPSSGPVLMDYRSGICVSLEGLDVKIEHQKGSGAIPNGTHQQASLLNGSIREDVIPAEISTGMEPDVVALLAFITLACCSNTSAGSSMACKPDCEGEVGEDGSAEETGVGEDESRGDVNKVINGRTGQDIDGESVEQAAESLMRDFMEGLGVFEGLGNAVLGIVAETSGAFSTKPKMEILSMKLPLTMLRAGHPQGFPDWAMFLVWRRCWEQLIEVVTFAQAAQLSAQGAEGGRRCYARLGGCLRRLRVMAEEEFESSEAADAVSALSDALADVAALVAKETAADGDGQHRNDRLFPAPGSEGWSVPTPVRLAVAARLLESTFPAEPEEGEAARLEMLSYLERRVWPSIGLTRGMLIGLQAWTTFTQYFHAEHCEWLAGECVAACHPAVEIVRNAAGRASSITGTATAAAVARPNVALYPEIYGQDADHASSVLCASVVDSIQLGVTAVLCDYFRWATELPSQQSCREKMRGLLQVLRALLRGNGSDGGELERVVGGLVEASVAAEFDRAVKLRDTESATGVMEVMDDVVFIIQEHEAKFADVMWEVLPAAQSTALKALHSLFGDKVLRPYLKSEVMSLTGDNLQLAQYADQLDAAILRASTGEPFSLAPVVKGAQDGEPLGSWAVTHALAPLLEAWVRSNVTALPTWTQRILEAERWGVAEGARKVTPSALELLTVLHETLDNLLGMELRLPAELLRRVLETMVKCVKDYSAAITAELPGRDDLAPPLPPLTRYKQQFVSKGELKERRSGSVGAHRPAPSTLSTSATDESSSVGGGRQYSPSQLAMLLNSLAAIAAQLPALNESVDKRWRPCGQLPRDAERAAPPPVDPYFVDRLFQDAETAVEAGIQKITEFISAQIVYVDLQAALCTDLYRWHVAEARLSPTLAQMNQLLGDIVSQVESVEVQRQVALQLLRECVQVLLRVLLDGGQARVFAESDAGMIEEDVERHLMAMFHAEGEGVDELDIETELAPLRDVYGLMAESSHALIARFHALPVPPEYSVAGASDGVPAPVYPTVGLAESPAVLLRVMCHRADRSCSKLLKERYRLPRTEESQMGLRAKLLMPASSSVLASTIWTARSSKKG